MNASVKIVRQTVKMAIRSLEKFDAILMHKFQMQIPEVNNARILMNNLIGGRVVTFRGGNYDNVEVTSRRMSFDISPSVSIHSASTPVLSSGSGNYTREGTSLRMFRNRSCSIYRINSSGADLLASKDGENYISSESTSFRTFHSTIPSMHIYGILSSTEVLTVMDGYNTESRPDARDNVTVEGERQEAGVTKQDKEADAGDDQMRSNYRGPGNDQDPGDDQESGEHSDPGNDQDHRDDWDPEDDRYLGDYLDPVYNRSCRDDRASEIYHCQKTDRHPVNAVMLGKGSFPKPGTDVQGNFEGIVQGRWQFITWAVWSNLEERVYRMTN